MCTSISLVSRIGFWISYKYVEIVYHDDGPRLAFGKSDLLSGKARTRSRSSIS